LTNACEAITNGAQIAGKIALIDRGGCTFVQKVKNAQAVGAIAVVVADSVPGCPATGLGGDDATITIPAVRITNDDGARLKSQLLLGTVNVTLVRDPALKAGTDPAGRVLVFTPTPYVTGSSVSHWDTSAQPDLLMEPALNQGLSSDVDLTLPAFLDIGWGNGTELSVGDPRAVIQRLRESFPNPASHGTTIRYSLARDEVVELRVYDLNGRVIARIEQGSQGKGEHVARWDGKDASGSPVAAGVYYYRLKTPSFDEGRHVVIVR
jgi:hypothetical protein